MYYKKVSCENYTWIKTDDITVSNNASDGFLVRLKGFIELVDLEIIVRVVSGLSRQCQTALIDIDFPTN